MKAHRVFFLLVLKHICTPPNQRIFCFTLDCPLAMLHIYTVMYAYVNACKCIGVEDGVWHLKGYICIG